MQNEICVISILIVLVFALATLNSSDQGCSANKKGVGTQPKTNHFKIASKLFQSKT